MAVYAPLYKNAKCCITTLVPFGVDKESALSVSPVMRLLALTITTGIGLACFWKEKIVVPVYH